MITRSNDADSAAEIAKILINENDRPEHIAYLMMKVSNILQDAIVNRGIKPLDKEGQNGLIQFATELQKAYIRRARQLRII